MLDSTDIKQIKRLINDALSTINVKTFGAIGNGKADDTVAIQNAINSAQSNSNSLSVFLPGGTYKITSPLTITRPILFAGSGRDWTTIQPSVGIFGFHVSGDVGPTLTDFSVTYPSQSPQNNTAAIQVDHIAGGECTNFTFRNLKIFYADAGISFVRASEWTVDGCLIENSASAGINVQNLNNGDSGDSTIVNSIIWNPLITSGTTYGIHWNSSGGLRICNNKINMFQIGILIDLQNGVNTGQIIITNNSIETAGFTGPLSGLRLQRNGNSGSLVNILVNNNEFHSWQEAVSAPIDVHGSWLKTLSILGNTFFGANNPSTVVFNLNTLSNFTIAYNVALSSNSSSVLINTGSTANLGIVGPNIKIFNWAANTINSTNTTTIAPN